MSGGVNSTGKVSSDKRSPTTTYNSEGNSSMSDIPRVNENNTNQEISSLEVLVSMDSLKLKDTDNQLASDLVSPLIRVKTNDTHYSRRTSYLYEDEDDLVSNFSHKQEESSIEELNPDIDFNKLDEFIKLERQNLVNRNIPNRRTSVINNDSRSIVSTREPSSSAINYTPKHILYKIKSSLADQGDSSDNSSFSDSEEKNRDGEGVKFNDAAENRYAYYSSDSEQTVHSSSLSSLLPANQSCRELFGSNENTWWLDCNNPTEAELRVLSTTFNIHPLTCEDIKTQDCREKVELFKNYYFVSFHTFDSDRQSPTFLKIINFYIVVFKHGILTFHFTSVPHPGVVRRRVNQLRDYVDVTADWLCYALIDDIIDSFAPVIKQIEVEADHIENLVFVCRDKNFGEMLTRIFASRKKIMNLLRLLSFKSDVIKMFKRCQEDLITKRNKSDAIPTATPNEVASEIISHPRTEVALYLDDIQDHVITMHQSLIAYEKMFSKSHSNYLAQLQVESFNANFRITEILSKVTLIGTMLIPLNLVTGLFGMNVVVPGQEIDSLVWFFSIVGFLCLLVTCGAIFGKWWVKSRFDYDSQLPNTA